jgi:hypothetical protein
MLKKLLSLFLIAGFLFINIISYAQEDEDGGAQAITTGTIVKIEGNLITIAPENGRSKLKTIKTKDTIGLKVGTRVRVEHGRISAMPEPIPHPPASK